MPEDDHLPSIEQLDDKIKLAKQRVNEESKAEPVAAGSAARVSVELLAGVVVGLLMGYYLDKWLDTSPVMLLICFSLGVLGSGLNIYRMFQKECEKDNKNE